MNLDDLFARIEEGETTDLNLVVKADVMGSIEALRDAFSKMDQSEVKINIIHAAVGGITETDVTLAAASDAIIIGFNVRPTGKTREVAERERLIFACIALFIRQLKISMRHVLVCFLLISWKRIQVSLKYVKPLRYLRLAPLPVVTLSRVKSLVMIRYVSFVMVQLSLRVPFIVCVASRMTLRVLLVVMNAVSVLMVIKILRSAIPLKAIVSLKRKGLNSHETRFFKPQGQRTGSRGYREYLII
mgnify:CR=1 FL=1